MKNSKKRVLKHLRSVSMCMLSFCLMTPSVSASDPIDLTSQAISSEGGRLAAKEALNAALKVARSKPSLAIATSVVCASCLATCVSASMCIACGILVAKTLG